MAVRKEWKGADTEGVAVARALSHPTRVRILMAMNAPQRRMSPKEFCHETGLGMGHASYHFRELALTGCIELVDTEQRRGATEHYYEPVRTAMAWAREWEALGSYVKQNFCASVLRGGVETAGRAIDAGTFEAQPNSHLSWNTMRVDLAGWERIGAIMDRTLAELLAIESEAGQRIDGGNPGFLASFLMSSFESPPPEQAGPDPRA
jgi:hypothetical protein